MNMLAFFAIAAMLGAIFALACGIAAMVSDDKVFHLRSEQWMGWRVAWQAIAALFAALLLATAAYGATPPSADCVYDYPMITAEECRTYRSDMLAARDDEERVALRDSLHKVMEARARERGVTADDWRGLSLPPLRASARATGAEIAGSLALLIAVGAAIFIVFRTLQPGHDRRLIRCPETGGVAFVRAAWVSRGKRGVADLQVRSCDLWPERSNCTRGCLERYEQAPSGSLVSIEALRPYEHR